jgi:putative tricarboxylic transport membrane protein
MDFLTNLALGFEVATVPANLAFCFIGALAGTLIGILPGIGPTAAIAMLLPVTFSLTPDGAIIMLAGIYYGTQYGGSTTAILLNLPGEASSAVTAIDGHQMARNGKAGTALAIAAIGSFFAGTVATLIIALLAKPLISVALLFGPWEYFSLLVLGLVAAVVLAHGSVLKAITMVVFGLLLGLVGTDVYSGERRFTFGILEFANGLDFVAFSVGIFGIAEIMRNMEAPDNRSFLSDKFNSLLPSRQDLRKSALPILRGTGIGAVLGILPGGGALLSSFASYVVEKKLSRTPERFGKGAIEGVAGPEAANNAGAQTSFIPMLTLGIPSNPVMALVVGAMIMQGIVPGPTVATSRPDLFWGVIASMWVGNVMLLVLNLPLVGLWVQLLKIPYHVLFPGIIVFASIGAYGINLNVYDVFSISVFGLLGYLFYKLDFEPAPLVLGFVLGPMLEEHLRRAMMLGQGDVTAFFLRPISASLLALAALLLAISLIPSINRERDVIFAEDS